MSIFDMSYNELTLGAQVYVLKESSDYITDTCESLKDFLKEITTVSELNDFSDLELEKRLSEVIQELEKQADECVEIKKLIKKALHEHYLFYTTPHKKSSSQASAKTTVTSNSKDSK